MGLEQQFLIRASAIGKIMTEPRSSKDKKSGQLSQTAMSYCDEWIREQLYNRKKETTSKYTAKGHLVEDESIEFISKMLNIPFICKNETRYYNEYIEGEPDIVPQIAPFQDLILDAKNSFSYETFPILDTKLPNDDYWWQGQGYLDLCKRRYYKVVYALTNTPQHMIDKEAWSHCRMYGYDDLVFEIHQQYQDRMTFDTVPDELRIKVFTFERDDVALARVYAKVIKCREYIKQKLETLPRHSNGRLIVTK